MLQASTRRLASHAAAAANKGGGRCVTDSTQCNNSHIVGMYVCMYVRRRVLVVSIKEKLQNHQF